MDLQDVGIETILISILLAIVIIGAFFYIVIKHASYGRKIWVEERKQTALLKAMAEREGVHQATIDQIFDEAQYKERN